MLKNQEWILTLYDHLIDYEVANHKVVPRRREFRWLNKACVAGQHIGFVRCAEFRLTGFPPDEISAM